jgi:hypothetical protein
MSDALKPTVIEPRAELLPPKEKALTKDDRKAELARIDQVIREKATKAVLAASRYAEIKASGGRKPEDMTDEEYQMAIDAAENDKNTPWGLKLNQRIWESAQKQGEEQARPPLALQINFFPRERREYEEVVVDDSTDQ